MKNNFLSGLAFLALLTTLAIVAWIGFSIYHQHTTSTISEQTSLQIVQITPSFNLKAVDSINKRKRVETDLQQVTVPSTPTPKVKAAPTAESKKPKDILPTLSP